MTALEDLALVVGLACITEDRTDAEQRALLNTALRLDNQRNLLTSNNTREGGASQLYDLANISRVLTEDDKPVRLPVKSVTAWQRRVDRWLPTIAERRYPPPGHPDGPPLDADERIAVETLEQHTGRPVDTIPTGGRL